MKHELDRRPGAPNIKILALKKFFSYSLDEYREASGLVVQCPQLCTWPSAAGVSCLWLLPKACGGDVDAG